MNTPLDPLADFRPDGYGLDDERRARLRSRVLDAIPDDAPAGVTTLVTARPTTSIDGRDERDELAGFQMLEPLPAGRRRAAGSRRHGHGPNGRRLLVAAAVAVALGLLAGIVGMSRSGEREVGTVNLIPVTLDELASLAAIQPDRALAQGEYQKVVITSATRSDDGSGSYQIAIDRNWHTVDDSGARQTTIMTLPDGGLPGDETDRIDQPFGDDPRCLACFGPFDYASMRSAPEDPMALLTAVGAAMPNEPGWALAEQLTTLTSLTSTPPRVRAAALRALDVLGFRPIGEVTPPSGRGGFGFAMDSDGSTEVIVFEPGSARGLAYWRTSDAATHDGRTAEHWAALSDVAISPLRA